MGNNLILALAFLFIGFLLGLMLPKVFDNRAEGRGQEPRKPVPPVPNRAGSNIYPPDAYLKPPAPPPPPIHRRNYEPPFPLPRPK